MNVKYYTDASNLKLDVQEGNIDVANRTLSATDIEDLRGNDNVKVVDGPGGEIRYLVFNFDTMPFGATTAEADPAKALAVRQAIADLIDRDAISEDVYKGTFTPLYSYVPEGLAGANEALKEPLRRRQRRARPRQGRRAARGGGHHHAGRAQHPVRGRALRAVVERRVRRSSRRTSSRAACSR